MSFLSVLLPTIVVLLTITFLSYRSFMLFLYFINKTRDSSVLPYSILGFDSTFLVEICPCWRWLWDLLRSCVYFTCYNFDRRLPKIAETFNPSFGWTIRIFSSPFKLQTSPPFSTLLTIFIILFNWSLFCHPVDSSQLWRRDQRDN